VSTPVTRRPTIRVNHDPSHRGPASVSVCCLGPEMAGLLAGSTRPADLLKRAFRVTVVQMQSSEGNRLPDVSGRYRVVEDEVEFTPTFPFDSNVEYRASFDPRLPGFAPAEEPSTLEFVIPSEHKETALSAVTRIFPSSDLLPENVLRFYVHFSNAMQRGRALEQISLLDSDGLAVPDALYRAPVELWDRAMRRLTVLLDPGRLKRWVGPNVALGLPLKTGHHYILEIGSGMIDLHGRPLREPFRKHFVAGDPVREPIAVRKWRLHRPAAGSRQVLVLTFANSLDWALPFETIRIESEDGLLIDGQIQVDHCETRWSLTPALPWVGGVYRVTVSSRLEDVCGNTPTGAFDRPLRNHLNTVAEAERSSFVFRLM
jgi:hypothetical protein